MQIVTGDNLHEMSKPCFLVFFFCKNKASVSNIFCWINLPCMLNVGIYLNSEKWVAPGKKGLMHKYPDQPMCVQSTCPIKARTTLVCRITCVNYIYLKKDDRHWFWYTNWSGSSVDQFSNGRQLTVEYSFNCQITNNHSDCTKDTPYFVRIDRLSKHST